MPIIGCTKENNCKRDAFLKARQLEAERTAGTAYSDLILRQHKSNNTRRCKNIIPHDPRANQNVQLLFYRGIRKPT